MLDLLRKRRSIRRYTDEVMEPEKVACLIKAALLAPSSRNLRPWEFIVVDNRDLLQALAASKEQGSSFLEDAAMGVVVIADPQKCDVWIEDASIAALVIHLAAESLNLGSCWIQIRERFHNASTAAEEYVKKLLNIPQQYKVECIIAIGYPGEKKNPHRDEELVYEKIHCNGYGQKWRMA